MIYVDLTLGDLGYSDARVEYKYCTEPQALGPYAIKVYLTINGYELEVFEQLRSQAKEYVVDECRRHYEETSIGVGA